ncbi:MAG: right-handed parallel beta-helix repeat-containing protein, partial [Acidobacteria bacterium]|nr:right-handed parallel beta-helix repeat-containing protein [Acidobacteriota bacterium]
MFPPAQLVITAEAPEIVDPGLPFETEIVLLNHGPYLASDVRVTIDAPDVDALQGPDECITAGAGRLLCEISVLGDRPRRLAIRGIAPADASGRSFSITSTIDGGEEGTDLRGDTTTAMISMWRTFYVANDRDDGEGSLRNAIEEANRSCSDEGRCKIAFRLDRGGDGWVTIAPETPLPQITGNGVFVDATTQTRFFGDTNPLGPEVELSGERVGATGNGLQIDAGSNAALRGLAINRFPEAGVAVSGVRNGLPEWYWDRTISSISDCYIGTDPTGTTALANSIGVRVSIYGDRTQFVGIWWINGNLISGNERSGVFSVSGTREVRGNRIGVNRDVTAALGNGASGVFIGPDNADITVEANVIAFNADFGVAVSEEAAKPLMLSNSIHSNGALGIDVGLDGVTMARRVARSEQPEAVFGLPVAHEDDAVRAVAAASELHRCLAQLNADAERDHGVRLAARVGIDTGEVMSGDPD